MRTGLITLCILLWSTQVYADCSKEKVCAMMEKMGHFAILDKCPDAGAFLIECKKSGDNPVEDLPQPNFVANDNGTVTDTNNKLIWLNRGIYKKFSLKKAKEFAVTAKESGISGWRIPTLPELKTLLQAEKVQNASGKKAWIHPLFNDEGNYYYWTTTTCEQVSFIKDRYQKKTCQLGAGAAWLVHFQIGAIIFHFVKAENYYLWLVKDAS